MAHPLPRTRVAAAPSPRAEIGTAVAKAVTNYVQPRDVHMAGFINMTNEVIQHFVSDAHSSLERSRGGQPAGH